MTMPSDQTIDLSQFAGDWVLDGSRSSIRFRSSSLWGLIKVKGTFTGLRGEAHIDPTGAVRGQLIVDASSVETGNKKRDNHLRSADFFKVDQHPEIVFELNAVEPGSDQHRLGGTLHIIGNSRPLDLAAQIQDQDESGLTLHAETTVDRSQWGVNFRKSGMVNMNTGLEITARFNRQG
jgi:polyisoprenoid-binding protein YceI